MGNPLALQFDDGDLSFFQQARNYTAVGRQATDAQNIDDNIAKLQAIKPINDQQRLRIAGLIAGLQKQKAGPSASTGTIVDARGEEQPAASTSDLVKGAAAGATEATLGPAEIASHAASVVPGPIGRVATRERGRIQEAQAEVGENVPQGPGKIAEVGGALAASAPIYGVMASKIAGLAEGGAIKYAPELTKAFLSKVDAASPLVQRAISAGVNVLTGLPINVAFFLDQIHDEPNVAKKQALIQSAADALFGAVNGKVGTDAMRNPAATPDATAIAPVTSTDRQTQLATKTAAIETKKQQLATDKQNRAVAKAEWQVANPKQSWAELGAPDKKAIYDAYVAKQQATATPTAQGGDVSQAGVPSAVAEPGGDQRFAPPPTQVDPIQAQLDKLKTDMAGAGQNVDKGGPKPGDIVNTNDVPGFKSDVAGGKRWWDKVSQQGDRESLLESLGVDKSIAGKSFDDLPPDVQNLLTQPFQRDANGKAFIPKPKQDIESWWNGLKDSDRADILGPGYEGHDYSELSDEGKKEIKDYFNLDQHLNDKVDKFPEQLPGKPFSVNKADDGSGNGLKEWWNSLHPEQKQDDLFGSGLVRPDEIDDFIHRDFDNLPNDLKGHLADLADQEGHDNAQPHVQEWNAMSDADKTAMANEWNKSKGIPPIPSDYEWHVPFRALDPSMQDFIQSRIIPDKANAKAAVDNLMGSKTAYEPSAAEQSARSTLPDDMRGPLSDLLINNHVEGWTPEQLQQKLSSFAAENELSPEQLQDGLKQFGHQDLSPTPTPSPTTPTPETPDLPPNSPSPSPTQEPAVDLTRLTNDQLDFMKEQMFKRVEKNPDDTEAMNFLHQLAAETKNRHELDVSQQMAKEYYDNEVVKQVNKPKEPVSRMDPKELTTLARTSPRKLTDDQLSRLIDEVGSRISGLAQSEGPEWRQLMDKLVAEKAARRPPPPLAQIPPPVFGAAIGFTYGMFTSDDEDRASNAFMYALVGAGGAYAASKLLKPKLGMRESSPELFPGQHSLPKAISYIDERKPIPVPIMSRARRFYAGMVRSAYNLEYIYEKTGGANLPVYYSAAKRAAIFGRWIGKAEYALTRGFMLDVNGEPVKLEGLPPHEQLRIAKGDIVNLDELAVARTVLEQMALHPNRSYPMDQMRAQLVYQSAPENLHAAADEMRKFALAGAQIAADGGLIDPAVISKFANETWFAYLHRVFGEGVSDRDVKDIIVSPQPIKGRTGGSTQMVKSPFETQSEMTPKLIRAAEYNKIKQDFIAYVRGLPEDIQKTLLVRAEGRTNTSMDFYKDRIAALRTLLPDLTIQDASNMATAFTEEVTAKNPHLTVYEDGVLRSYKVDGGVFDAFKSMLPTEKSAFLQFVAAPSRLAAKGVVANPWFIAMWAGMMQPFHAALQSQYGFVPFIDNIKGWWNIVRDTPAYRKIAAEGGIGSMATLPYASAEQSIKASKVQATSVGGRALAQIREMKPLDAWRTITTPFAEAAQMGEALRALDHGASTMEAVYAAWHVLGNNRAEGSFAAMRALNQITLFSRPIISALDEMVVKTGLHPFRDPRASQSTFASLSRALGVSNDRAISGAEFAMKGFAYISIPSMLLWYANKDDKEIQEVRNTEGAERYWLFRTPSGDIAKIRKPYVLGPMFGGLVEHVLDQQNGKDPDGLSRWMDALVNDVAFNVLPQIGVIPASLIANKQWGFGAPVVPEGQDKLEVQMQGYDKATNPARVVSQAISPLSNKLSPDGFFSSAVRRALSPAGIDFITSNIFGIMGQDALKAVDMASKTQDQTTPTAKDELPLVGRLYAKYPSMNTRAVRDFYDNASRIEITNNSMNELLKSKPELAVQYIESHQFEIAMAPVFSQSRTQISNLTRAINEMKELLQHGQITKAEYDTTEKGLLQTINQIAEQANATRQSLKDQPMTSVYKAAAQASPGSSSPPQ